MDARASTAAGEGLAAARSGGRAVFVVHAADRFGNSVAAPPEAPGAPGFRAEITGSQVHKFLSFITFLVTVVDRIMAGPSVKHKGATRPFPY